MTQAVEQLQLSKEEEDEDKDENHNISSVEFFIQKMAFLDPPKDWVQREERTSCHAKTPVNYST
jgi:hypothetical protein